MSEDLIKREDAINEIRKSIIPHDMACAHYSNLCINAVRRVSSADRPQGEWKEVEEDWRHQIEFWKCSECEFAVSSMHNYCPNCGADMRKGVDDEHTV